MSREIIPIEILDDAFLAVQKQRLEALCRQLILVADAAARNEEGLALESVDEVRDNADSAETMAMQENDEAMFQRNLKRLEVVRRALEKLAPGTYGISDISGDPISRARLESIPEAATNPGEELRS